MIWFLIHLWLLVGYAACNAIFVPPPTRQRYMQRKDAAYWMANGLMVALWAAAIIQCFILPSTLPLWLHIGGIFLSIIGGSLVVAAYRANRSFSPVLGVPNETITSGIYRLRHPAYIGMCLTAIGYVLIFGQSWAAIPASLYITLLVHRARLENKLLYR